LSSSASASLSGSFSSTEEGSWGGSAAGEALLDGLARGGRRSARPLFGCGCSLTVSSFFAGPSYSIFAGGSAGVAVGGGGRLVLASEDKRASSASIRCCCERICSPCEASWPRSSSTCASRSALFPVAHESAAQMGIASQRSLGGCSRGKG